MQGTYFSRVIVIKIHIGEPYLMRQGRVFLFIKLLVLFELFESVFQLISGEALSVLVHHAWKREQKKRNEVLGN